MTIVKCCNAPFGVVFGVFLGYDSSINNINNKNMQESTKKLHRSKEERIIAGVAGGIGEYFNIDPVLVRITFVALALVHGLGILLYILFWLIVPNEDGGDIAGKVASLSAILKKSEEKLANKIKELKKDDDGSQPAPPQEAGSHDKSAEEPLGNKESWLKDKKRVAGLAIVILGAASLFNSLFHVSWFRWDIFWPIALMIIGLYLLVRKTNHPVS